jgi:hypothetical protein
MSTPIDAIVAARQRAALSGARRVGQATPHETTEPRRPSRWAHVPLAELFEQAGNMVYSRADGRQECGHEPEHSSRSGRCVLLDAARGYWYCRSCHGGGDAATLVQALHGLPYMDAAGWLTERYGAPATPARKRQRRPLWRTLL